MGLSGFNRAREKRAREAAKNDNIDLESMVIRELQTYAAEKNIDISGLKKKSEIIDALNKG